VGFDVATTRSCGPAVLVLLWSPRSSPTTAMTPNTTHATTIVASICSSALRPARRRCARVTLPVFTFPSPE
jgi:hypothetical protein